MDMNNNVNVKISKINSKFAEVLLNDVKIGSLTYSRAREMFCFHNDGEYYESKKLEDIKKHVSDNYVFMYDEKNIYNEWIVEQYVPFKKCMVVIGKLLFNMSTIHLSSYELDEIWDVCNYECSHSQSVVVISDSCYNGSIAYESNTKYIVFMPTENAKGVVNCDIYIRPHNDIEHGYYLLQDRKNNIDKWLYSDSRDEIILQMKLQNLSL